MTADAAWWYAKDEVRHGPIPFSDLVNLAASGNILAGDPVWTDGFDTWRPAGSVEGLQFSAADGGPPPLPPPMRDHQFGSAPEPRSAPTLRDLAWHPNAETHAPDSSSATKGALLTAAAALAVLIAVVADYKERQRAQPLDEAQIEQSSLAGTSRPVAVAPSEVATVSLRDLAMFAARYSGQEVSVHVQIGMVATDGDAAWVYQLHGISTDGAPEPQFDICGLVTDDQDFARSVADLRGTRVTLQGTYRRSYDFHELQLCDHVIDLTGYKS